MTRLVAVLMLGALLAGAQKTASDDEIFDNVRRRLANDPEVRGAAFEVSVEQGVVRVRGKVDKEKVRQKAERLALKVNGVKKVINELRVEPR